MNSFCRNDNWWSLQSIKWIEVIISSIWRRFLCTKFTFNQLVHLHDKTHLKYFNSDVNKFRFEDKKLKKNNDFKNEKTNNELNYKSEKSERNVSSDKHDSITTFFHMKNGYRN